MEFKRRKSIYHITVPIGLVSLWVIETIQGKIIYGSLTPFHYLAPTLVGISIGWVSGFLYSLRARYKLRSEQFRAVVDVAQEFIFLRKLDGQYEYVSPSCQRITGYEPSDFYATPNLMDQLIHEADRDRWKNHVHRINDGGQQESFDIRIISKSKQVVWINHICMPVYDEAGEKTGVRSSNLNITERKIHEDKLRQASILYNNTTEAVVITEPQGHVVATNKAFTVITGYDEKEVVGKTPRYWKSNKHEPDFYQNLWNELLETDQWRGEIWNRRKNGEIYPALLTINSVRNEKQQLTHYVSILTDISTIKHSQEEIEFLAHHDSLTKLPNRLLFNARLDHAKKQADREKKQVAVLFMDLDNFKSINDGLGHSMGDKVLQVIANRLAGLVRDQDTVARISGDEFAIILEQLQSEVAAAQVANKVLETIHEPIQIGDHEFTVSISIGISLFPNDGNEIDTLIKNADAAMYRSKEQGKGQYCFYTRELTELSQDRLKIENLLRRALEKQEFKLNYQPQYEMVSGQLLGCEALLRWHSDELGLVSPGKFIPIAESSGMIMAIGDWVLTESCRQAKSWIDAGYPPKMMSVNISGQQIMHSDVVETVKKVLSETGLDPQYLELEITESVIMRQPDKAIGVLESLRDIGVSLAIDDFGTGYSSLSYLKIFPINKLKIDRSFVKDIPDDSDDVAIICAIIALGKSLKLKVIAEGVETEAQQEALKQFGCTEVQGFFYSKPIPAHEFESLF